MKYLVTGVLLAVVSAALIEGGAARMPQVLAIETDESALREAARLRSLAAAEMEEGSCGHAEPLLRDLARILPDNILPPINLAVCYFLLDRRNDALEQIARARQLDPDNPQMLYALARILERGPEDRAAWLEVLDHFATVRPHDPRPYYLRAQGLAFDKSFTEAIPFLEAALNQAPDNLVLMVELLTVSAQAKDPFVTSDALDAIEDRLQGFDGALTEYAEQIRDHLKSGDVEAARPPAMVIGNLLRPTDLYQLGRVELSGPIQGGDLFPQLDFDPPLPKSIQGGGDIDVAFQDATAETGLEGVSPVSGLVWSPSPDDATLVSARDGSLLRLELQNGRFGFQSIPLATRVREPAISFDFDQDELPDLITADGKGGVVFHAGRADGTYGEAIQAMRGNGANRLLRLYPLDVDHDGDLDIFGARTGRDVYLQNNGDGRWTERAGELGLAGEPSTTTDVVSADLDNDGDLDLLVVQPEHGPRLYVNRRAGTFIEATERLGLDQLQAVYTAVRTADFNNDGLFDLFLWGPEGGLLVQNRGLEFQSTPIPTAPGGTWHAAEVLDAENDGDQDILVVAAEELVLLRNRDGQLIPEKTGQGAAPVGQLLAEDLDSDGDVDILAALADGRLKYWRNEGGNRNNWLRLQLKGKNDNNGKNNTQGIFVRIETRSGDAFQVVQGNGGINHLGLGARRQADVIRAVWTNGVPQTWQQVGANRTLVEEQVLKGSCPFLYVWDGEAFTFVTDLMWKSPLGMILADGTRAPHQSARDFVMIAGERLRPVGGEIWIQTTEELWEAAYVDQQELIAVDYPTSVELLIDEKFSPPPHSAEPSVHWVDRLLDPVAARDQEDRDVSWKIRDLDGIHVDDLPLDRYQGLTRGHELRLTFSGVPAGERLRLLLWGWIFPTDSSINLALSQDSSRAPRPPQLEVLKSDGRWQPLDVWVGFPNGKRKVVVVELPGEIPSGEVTLKLSTNLQIYWDAARLAIGDPVIAPVVTSLKPRAADLHFRGFSRVYRETPTGPHLFDYEHVSVEPRFRDMIGPFTRYGSVEELLQVADDRYVVMNAGDEMTVRFDAMKLPLLPPGWRRDFILSTDGWVKDGDLNTLLSKTVEPLPYHAMESYPDQPTHHYPDSSVHREYRETFQTRWVTDQHFREFLQAPRKW
ncbi:MAG: FG-GAP-like repeat-containing protein [Thermoanaerobaculia bacterium]